MGRAEVGTPKYLANKMKAKGLQKLRWYCQMCQKQCRDENGFKCHTMSESHQRQLLLFADNSKKYIDAFSHEFATGYLELLRRRFGTKRVNANKVYQEYIADRNHLHMNATRWLSLTGFVLYLGKTGKCTVDETEKGWYITYIDRDPETIAQQEKMKKKEKMDKDDEERLLEFIEYQVERGKKEPAESGDESAPKEFVRENEDEQIKLNINLKSITQSKPVLTTISAINEFKRPSKESYDEATSSKQYKSSSKEVKRKTALDEIIQAEEARKERRRTDYWLAENIVVKLVTKALGDKYYKQKAIVTEVIDKYKAKIKLLESGEKLKVDQEHLETVIPAIGKHVLIVNGGYKAEKATLKDVDERNFCVTLEIASGLLKGRILKKIQYEDISKLA